jgi:methyltransferase (TIGR00027 family)
MTHPASQTAVGPMVIVAVEQYSNPDRRLFQDGLAYHFLPTGVKFLVRLARWRPVRAWLIAMTEKTARGIWGSMLCRKRYIDDTIRTMIREIDALVILGAGLDTLAYRMESLDKLAVFEVDLPENIAYKRSKLERQYGHVPASVRLIPIDFEHQDLETVLNDHGYRASQRTFFVWEGVTQYLSEHAVRKTFDFLAKVAPGSRLVFTYVHQDFMDGVNLYGAARIYKRFRVKQKLWRFGMVPSQVAAFLEAYHWREVEQMGSQECAARYIATSGREMPISEIERAVYAEKIEQIHEAD